MKHEYQKYYTMVGFERVGMQVVYSIPKIGGCVDSALIPRPSEANYREKESMLKIFFGVAGLLFIGLGLFGGNVLEGFSGSDSAKARLQASAAATVETESTGQTAVVTTGSVSDTSASAIVPSDATPQIAAASAVAEDNSSQQLPKEEIVAAADTVAESAIKPADSMIKVADNSGGEGAEPIAPAQAAGDLIAMTEQVKSSNRNDQVTMAKAVLTPEKQLPESVVVEIVDKTVEVETAINSTSGVLGNDPLIVIKDKVNLRDGPSIDHPIVLTLQQGQELMEFKREGKWVHVGAYGTSGKIGWVHERLVGPVAR